MKKLYVILVLLAFTALHLAASTNIYAPTLVDPEDGDDDLDPELVLDWEAVSGGIGLYYKLQLSTDSLFGNYEEFETELSNQIVSDLHFDTIYYWRVKAIDESGESEWSEVWHFLIRVGVELRDPDSGDDDLPANFKISWRDINGIDYFDYQIDTNANFDSPALVSTHTTGDVTEVNASNLFFATDYFVQVRARHANDTTIWTDTVDVRTIETFPIEDPNDGETEVMPNAKLSWDDVKGINKYILQLAFDENLEVIVSSDELTSESVDADTLDFGTTYFMNVAAVHATDTLYSDTISFETINTVTLNTPADEATNIPVGPTLNWIKVYGCSKYQLQFSNEPELDAVEPIEIVNTNPSGYMSYQVPASLTDSGMTYYWRVNALHNADTTMWSDTWSFTIAAVGIGENDVNAFNIYPNPANEQVRIVFEAPVKDALIRISDLTGKTIREIKRDGVTTDLPIDLDINTGLYLLTVETDKGINTRKLLIR